MMILLTILKIIGWILLAVVALLLFVVLTALFVPVGYRVEGSFHKEMKLSARVSWLFHLFVFGLDHRSGQNEIFIRLFGIKKSLNAADNRRENEDTKGNTAGDADDVYEAEQAAEVSGEKITMVMQERTSDGGSVTEEWPPGGGDIPQESTSESGSIAKEPPPESGSAAKEPLSDGGGTAKEPPPGHRRKAKRGADKDNKDSNDSKDSKNKKDNMSDKDSGPKSRDIAGTYTRVRDMVSDENHKAAVRFLLGKLSVLLRRILPKKLKLTLEYSTGSPDTTGEVLGVIAMFPATYQNRWQIRPDFTSEKAYIDTEFDVRGRIFLFQFVGIFLSVALDKNCRRLYNELRRLR